MSDVRRYAVWPEPRSRSTSLKGSRPSVPHGTNFCVIEFYYMFICVSCFGLVVSTCQVVGYRKTPLMTPSSGEEIISTKPRWKRVFVCIFLLFILSMLLYLSPWKTSNVHLGYTLEVFHLTATRTSSYSPVGPNVFLCI